MRGRTKALSGAALALSPMVAAIARAEPPSTAGRPVRLDYAAPEECPDAGRFLAQVSARTGATRAAAIGEPARTLHVSIRRDGARTEGEVRMEDDPVPRKLEAPTCSAVVEGLALVAAVMLEAADSSPQQPVETPPPAARRETVAPPDTARAAEETTSPRPGVGAGFDVIGYAAPAAMLGGSAFGELGFGTTSPWQPTLRLSVGIATTGSTALGSGAATFTLYAARIAGCPLVGRLAGISFYPCVHVEGGQMAADGVARGELVEPYESRAAWLGTGLDVGLRARLGSHFFAEIGGAATLPLLKRSYVFDNPREVVHATPAVALRSTIAIGLAHP